MPQPTPCADPLARIAVRLLSTAAICLGGCDGDGPTGTFARGLEATTGTAGSGGHAARDPEAGLEIEVSDVTCSVDSDGFRLTGAGTAEAPVGAELRAELERGGAQPFVVDVTCSDWAQDGRVCSRSDSEPGTSEFELHLSVTCGNSCVWQPPLRRVVVWLQLPEEDSTVAAVVEAGCPPWR